MVGERLVSVCGWDGGATMRSVAVTVRERLRFFFWIASRILFSGRSPQYQDSISPFDGMLLCSSFSRWCALLLVFMMRSLSTNTMNAGNWMVSGGFDGTVTIYKSTNRFEDWEWTPYFWNRSHASMITHCRRVIVLDSSVTLLV